ncbi:hypothetical protein EGR_11147 [Echinococcus granulosus]|uniref:Uncharacterized protein n=1 Tax=Echinococcus granulosus TaxID=6210 RepID=W6U0P0_ECHGR|nr:hypothetical protein EGR_11147 [Echinococcus granulosus]EUB53996.1 hypothetical protein EGR_11147 [Echinococcus granulosus]
MEPRDTTVYFHCYVIEKDKQQPISIPSRRRTWHWRKGSEINQVLYFTALFYGETSYNGKGVNKEPPPTLQIPNHNAFCMAILNYQPHITWTISAIAKAFYHLEKNIPPKLSKANFNENLLKVKSLFYATVCCRTSSEMQDKQTTVRLIMQRKYEVGCIWKHIGIKDGYNLDRGRGALRHSEIHKR